MKVSEHFKNKILKQNVLSIYITTLFLIFSFFAITFFVIYKKYSTEKNFIKTNFIEHQKLMMQHQTENLIKLIDTLKHEKYTSIKEKLKTFNLSTSAILAKSNKKNFQFILRNIDNLDNLIFLTLSDLNANPIYTNLNDYNKTKRKNVIKKLLTQHKNDIYYTHYTSKGIKITFQHIFDNYFLTTCTYEKKIDKLIQQRLKQIIYNIKFGPNNNGYISIYEIKNNKIKIIINPINPNLEGSFLNKQNLKNFTDNQFITSNNTKNNHSKKIEFIKIYKPWNWIIVSNIFIDDINKILYKKEKAFEYEIKKLIAIYLILSTVTLLLIHFIIKKLNASVKKIVSSYEGVIESKNKLLQKINQNLHLEVEKKTTELIENMFSDKLTNLPNREKLINDIKNNFIAIINIDDFKEINDFYGVEEGDKVIKEVAKFLNSIAPTYKLSGDEYAIIAPLPAKLKHIISEIIKKLKSKKFKVGKDEIKISITVGIGKTLAEADIALKYAKKRKKQIIVYNKKLPILKEFEENLKWKKIINEAIEKDNVIPFVQPIIHNKTKKVYKYECLMRIYHNGKFYTPYFFLNIAKKTHQYETLQAIMIQKCFETFSKLPYNFSINLSLSDLKNDQFRMFLFKKIEEYKIAPKLTIELLEDEEMISDKKLNEIIYQLSKTGAKIAIDDFGSGYSNFVYLIKNLPIDIIKIDGSLIKDILKDEKLKKFLKKIVEIAHDFDFETIAEFVENEELFNEISKLNIHASQGYFFSPPFDIRELK
ncbi:MAG: EAL domain-containing protein [Nautiliaceae bacterium]